MPDFNPFESNPGKAPRGQMQIQMAVKLGELSTAIQCMLPDCKHMFNEGLFFVFLTPAGEIDYNNLRGICPHCLAAFLTRYNANHPGEHLDVQIDTNIEGPDFAERLDKCVAEALGGYSISLVDRAVLIRKILETFDEGKF